jgi:hypothetical protein
MELPPNVIVRLAWLTLLDPAPMALQVARLPAVVQPPVQPSKIVPVVVAPLSAAMLSEPKAILLAVATQVTARAGEVAPSPARISAASQTPASRRAI